MALALATRNGAPVAARPMAAARMAQPKRATALRWDANRTDGAASLDGFASRLSLARGATIFHEGDRAEHYYKVVSGAVVLYKLLLDGRRQITDFFVAGDFFGVGEGQLHGFAAEPVSDVVVLRYPRRQVDRLAHSDPETGRWLLELMCRNLNAAQSQIVLLGAKSALERVATFLLAFARRLEHEGKDGAPLHLPMRRKDIADYLGLTLETVSRTFSALRQEGAIELRNHDEVTFLDRAALEMIAEGNQTAAM